MKKRSLQLAVAMAAPSAAVTAFVLSPPLSLPRVKTTPTTTPTTTHTPQSPKSLLRVPTLVALRAPPNSGYFSDADEVSALPDTYEPMWEYPGTMRPGRTPENIPFQDLPIGDADPDPVPWPHFQEIDWHHRWDPPHLNPMPMEKFIDLHGRWATPELEAAMRAGARRGVRERREAEEAERRGTIITDDDEEDDEMQIDEEPVELGDGIFGQLGSAADQAATAAAVDPKNQDNDQVSKVGLFDDSQEDTGDDGSLDDFLLDLGLDTELDEDLDDNEAQEDDDDASSTPVAQAKSLRELESDDEDDDDKVDQGVKAIQVDDDDDLDFVVDDDEEGATGAGASVPLDDFGDAENGGLPDTDDIFDEGGFDFGDEGGDFGDMDGGDDW